MTVLQNTNLNLDIFYKNKTIPKISIGDKVKVVIFLELPKNGGESGKRNKKSQMNNLREAGFWIAVMKIKRMSTLI